MFELIDAYWFGHAEKIFTKAEKYLNLEASFLQGFWRDASMLLDYAKNHKMDRSPASKEIEKIMVDELLFKILKYLNKTEDISRSRRIRKRDIALKISIDHINDNKNRLLSVKELCKVAQVSERTLEYAFLEKFQVNPSAYIKAIHLDSVKKELIKLKGRKIRVSDVAIKYGFHHMGQFSVDFKKHFGISPSKIR